MAIRRGVRFARLYYRAAERFLDEFYRQEAPWHTETDPYDPINAIKRAQAALAGHRNACLADRVAESFSWDDLATRPEAVALARIMGVRLLRDTPATALIVAALSQRITAGMAPARLVDTGAIVSTRSSDANGSVDYESLGDPIDADETAFTFKKVDDAGAEVAYAMGDKLFSDPAERGEAFYVGHPQLMFDRLDWVLSAVNDGDLHVSAEYLDTGCVGTPDAVVVDGDALVFTLDTFLGTTGDAICRYGLTVRITHLASGQYADVVMPHSTPYGAATVPSWLGQGTPSTEATDYEVTSTWTPFRATENEITGTCGQLAASGNSVLRLPQMDTRRWVKGAVLGTEAYWVRFRVTKIGTSAVPRATSCGNTGGNWWVAWLATQGRTVNDECGTADGTAFQRFALPSAPYIDGSVSQVAFGADPTWTEFDSLYHATDADKAFVVNESDDGTVEIVTGDGTNGMLPPPGGLCTAVYRVGASVTGNAGAGEIAVGRTGLYLLGQIVNPWVATGWAAADGSTQASLDRVRWTAPARARAGKRAVTPEDYETLAVSEFTTETGAKPVVRAVAVEQGAGPQSILLVVSGVGGAALSSDDLAACEAYFNGQTIDLQRVGGVGIGNTTCYARNHQALDVDVDITVRFMSGTSAGKAAAINAALTAVLRPDATMADWKTATGKADQITPDDVATWLWRLLGKVQRSRLSAVALAAAGVGVEDVDSLTLNGVSANVDLTGTQLPHAGTVSVSIVED